MSALRELLEASLQEHWDRATLEVYGDYLQSLGDPRGDLIAIDRQIRMTGLTCALARQRHAAACAWLGGETIGEYGFDPRWFRDGFLELLICDNDIDIAPVQPRLDRREFLRDALASPAGPYLRRLYLAMSGEGIAHALEILSGGRHPWLTHLVLAKTDFWVWPAITEAFFDATPWLHTLRSTRQAPRSLPHPALRRLELADGWNSCDLLEDSMPNIVEIQLGFGANEDLSALASLFRPQRLPALRRLDLALNEETERQSPYCSLACGFVASLEVRDQITHLSLPSVRSADDAAHVRALLSSMPGIVELSFSRRYACFDTHGAGLDHPAIVLPPRRPWPPERLSGRYNTPARARVTFSDGAGFVFHYMWHLWSAEHGFDDLAEPVQRAWCELWPVLAELDAAADPSRAFHIPAATLARALQVAVSLEDLRFDSDCDLGEAIHARQTGPDETVELRWESDVD